MDKIFARDMVEVSSNTNVHILDLKYLLIKKIANLAIIQKNDIVIMDRGFVDIEFVQKFHKRNIKVVLLVKSSMMIYDIAVDEAIRQNEWKKHPNPKRKGQEIALVADLKGLWIYEIDKNKKTGKERNEEINFNACVIRISKKEPDKKIAEALKKDNNIDDIDYVYVVILIVK